MNPRNIIHPTLAIGLTLTTPLFAAQTIEKESTLLNDLLQKQSSSYSAWDIGMELRSRYEIKDDAGVTPNTDFISGVADDRTAIYLREKIHVGYKGEWFGAFIEGRDATGHEDLKADDTFDLHQAYLTVGNAKEFPFTAKIGRQELVYGDERFLGKGDWNNTGRSFDAVKVRFENSFGWVDAFAGRVVIADDHNFNVSNDYDNLSGIYASSGKLLPWQETQVYFLARNYGTQAANAIAPGNPGSPSTQRDIYTLGTLWKSDEKQFGSWDYSLEMAYQFGSVYNKAQDTRLDQQSYGIFASAGYTWKKAWGKPRIALGYEHGSGDGDVSDGKVETFENLFGTQHRPYGLMDLAGARNMHIPKLSYAIKPVKGLTLSADYLGFFLANTADYFYPESGSGRSGNGYGINSSYSNFVGTELDLYANYKINRWANYQLGYGHFFVGDYIKDTAGSAATDADWFYTQLTFNF